jgi:glycolate oxidase FAD binding subunit
MIHTPATEEEVRAIVADALARRVPLAIEGGGTRRGLGRPVQAAETLSLKALSGITLYEPSEMVIGAWAGTPLAEVQKTLDEKGQMLAFEPPDHRKLLGSTGEPTIGAVAACNLSGPRRVMAGAARDSLIGVRFVNGRGEIIKNGGRVMKNVTGLDLVKLQAGAYGTLGVLTEVIFKVVPKPAAVMMLQIEGIASYAKAVEAMSAALQSPYEITGAAHWHGETLPGADLTFLRIEGFPEHFAYRRGKLSTLLSGFGEVEEGWGTDVWQDIAEPKPISEYNAECVWKVSLPPSKTASFISEVNLLASLDWGGALVWIWAWKADAEVAALVSAAAARHGGHATLVKAPDAMRAATPVFQPLDPAVQKLQAGLKASFDPEGILNPGRMYAGV